MAALARKPPAAAGAGGGGGGGGERVAAVVSFGPDGELGGWEICLDDEAA